MKKTSLGPFSGKTMSTFE